MTNRYCFFEICIYDKYHNFILFKDILIIELFFHIVPKTCLNFYKILCGQNDKKLYYKNKKISRIVKGFYIQFDNLSEDTIYGKYFEDEIYYDSEGIFSEKNYTHSREKISEEDLDKRLEKLGIDKKKISEEDLRKLEKEELEKSKFLLSTVSDSNMNDSQFIITTDKIPYFDGSHTVFGKIVKGFSTIMTLESIPTDIQGVISKNIEINVTECNIYEKDIRYIENIKYKYENMLYIQNIINIVNQVKKIHIDENKKNKNNIKKFNFI